MASAKAKPEFSTIKDDRAFTEALEVTSNEVIVLVDVHQDWCGPTAAILSFLNQLWIDLDNASSKIQLLSAAIDDSTVAINSAIQKACGNDVKLAKQGCRPLFLVLRHGNVVAAVDGVDAPMLNTYLQQYLPKPAKKD